MSDHRDIDELSGVETTGHSWDGIKELNNPLPRWWLWTFYATVVFAVLYSIAYPALPLINSATGGVLGWSSRGDLRTELTAAEAGKAAMRERIKSTPVEGILADPGLKIFAIASGASMFKVNCAPCHGSGAQGSRGYPNLNDDSWIWGGTPEQILQTIAHGVRDQTASETRIMEMPAFGRDQTLTPAQIGDVTAHVLSIAKLDADAAAAARGAPLYAENCASCHGEAGEGNTEMGAPQLNDAIWLYGGTAGEIATQINAPRHGMMPAWQNRLGEAVVKELAVYVHALGGGQ